MNSKRVYISADYSEADGDRDVIDVLHSWGADNKHKTDFVDTAEVVSGSVSKDADCRACDLKAEFNRQINASSAVIIVIGDKTASRTAGSSCERSNKDWVFCDCTPYKDNTNGKKQCKFRSTSKVRPNEDYGNINSCSYIEHEFRQAKKKGKNIIVVYNSLYRQPLWLPNYMSGYGDSAWPFWKKNDYGKKVGDYESLKKALDFD